ncbi:MAG: carboxypeptidase regulatory-like domain-containing protein [Bacteroidetes bacterium]|nr:MAG: carboxypeptidase regulatory-like domain-containing protein [Bacteroidota bacterium]
MFKSIFLLLPFIFSGSYSGNIFQSNNQPEQANAVLTYCEEGDNEDSQPMLSGSVSYSSNPLYHACVEVRTTGGVLVSVIGTDSIGHYFFNVLSNGSYNLIVSYPGLSPKTTPITISGTPQTVNVSLD